MVPPPLTTPVTWAWACVPFANGVAPPTARNRTSTGEPSAGRFAPVIPRAAGVARAAVVTAPIVVSVGALYVTVPADVDGHAELPMSRPTATTFVEPGVQRSAIGSGIETTPPAPTDAVAWACAWVPAAKIRAPPAAVSVTPIGVPTGGALFKVTVTVPGFIALTLAARAAATLGPTKLTVVAPDSAHAPEAKIRRNDAVDVLPAHTRARGDVVVTVVAAVIAPGRSTEVRVPSPKIGSAEDHRTVTCVVGATVGPKRTPVIVSACGVMAFTVAGAIDETAGAWYRSVPGTA